MKRTALLGCLVLNACAGNQDTRTLASSTGLYVGSLNEGTNAFVEDQNALNAENAAHLDRLVSYGHHDLADIARQRIAWTVAGEHDRLAALDAASSVREDAILSQLQPATTQPAKVAPLSGTNYETAMKRLAELSAKPRPLDLLKSAAAYFGEVKKNYDKLADDAAAARKATPEKTNDADAAASVATTSSTGK